MCRHLLESIRYIVDPNPTSLSFRKIGNLTWYQSLIGGRSSVRTSPLYVYFPNLLNPCVSLKMELRLEEGC